MLKKYLCWVLGHKTMVKAFTGNKIADGTGMDLLLYRWQREKYCVRCGMEVWR